MAAAIFEITILTECDLFANHARIIQKFDPIWLAGAANARNKNEKQDVPIWLADAAKNVQNMRFSKLATLLSTKIIQSG